MHLLLIMLNIYNHSIKTYKSEQYHGLKNRLHLNMWEIKYIIICIILLIVLMKITYIFSKKISLYAQI